MDRKTAIKLMAALPLGLTTFSLRSFAKAVSEQKDSAPLPALFVGHGSPENVIQDNTWTRNWASFGQEVLNIRKPEAILVVSAHWLSRGGTYVNVSEHPRTIYDFQGFPQEMYSLSYPAPGAPAIASEIAERFPHIHETEEWGLDHGTWAVLLKMFPEADIPVFQLSIDYAQPLTYHLELGKQLAYLRKKGILIIGSGNVVHNLRQSIRGMQLGEEKPYDWALEFDDWAAKKIEYKAVNALVQPEKAVGGNLSVPTPDHYIPLLYSMGLAGKDDEIRQWNDDVFLGISMRSVVIS